MVIDGLGIGELPDAGLYNDEGSHTLDNMAEAAGELSLPHFTALGLGCIEGVRSISEVQSPGASYGRMAEVSAGKDTLTGHWEMAGVVVKKPFATFPNGFTDEIMLEFERHTGYGWLCGKPASGTEIIERLGAEHIKTKKLIVYTSADSVFQIAAHRDVFTNDELYRVCLVCREFLDKYNIARVIARPFAGQIGSFSRTNDRKDFSIAPGCDTLLDILKADGREVVGIGKLGDIFAHRGFTNTVEAKGNAAVVDAVLEQMTLVDSGLIFANLNDFDTLFGHRNDALGYAKALEQTDARVPEITGSLGPAGLLIITADHGCDPTTPSTDHSREYVPLLVCGGGVKKKGIALGTRKSFADIGQTVAEFFDCPPLKNGESFLGDILDA